MAALPLPEPPPGSAAPRRPSRTPLAAGRTTAPGAAAFFSPEERARRAARFLQASRLTPIRDLLEGTPGRGR